MSILKLTSFAQTSAYQTEKPVAAYYANWSAYSGYTPLNIPAGKLTYLNYAFAKIGEDLKIALGDPCVDPGNLAQLSQLKQAYPQLQTLISIGGWCDSGKFSDAALTDSSRAAFADSVLAFIKRYKFDGVDIDWEYPVGGGLSGNRSRSADKTNFTLLLQKLREKLDAQGKADGRKYLLTIAGGADSSYAEKTQLRQIADDVDYATIMTYDIHGHWDCYTDLNAPLYTPLAASLNINGVWINLFIHGPPTVFPHLKSCWAFRFTDTYIPVFPVAETDCISVFRRPSPYPTTTYVRNFYIARALPHALIPPLSSHGCLTALPLSLTTTKLPSSTKRSM